MDMEKPYLLEDSTLNKRKGKQQALNTLILASPILAIPSASLIILSLTNQVFNI
jgi:hypothetical protein